MMPHIRIAAMRSIEMAEKPLEIAGALRAGHFDECLRGDKEGWTDMAKNEDRGRLYKPLLRRIRFNLISLRHAHCVSHRKSVIHP